eukprot:15289107-Alexandrium_andersonii.AAC.1
MEEHVRSNTKRKRDNSEQWRTTQEQEQSPGEDAEAGEGGRGGAGRARYATQQQHRLQQSGRKGDLR